MTSLSSDTIAAIATPSGRGGVGIVRISGPRTTEIMLKMLGTSIPPRHAHYGHFYEQSSFYELATFHEQSSASETNTSLQVLDTGIALFFPGPNSFTGEDVLELQGHGGPVVLDCLLRETLRLGARLARPGEFSERAFLNDKIDLTQAEAIADLIDSASEQAARSALRSLQGEFSRCIDSLIDDLTRLRIYVEAAIDFPEEEIDFLADGKVANDLRELLEQLDRVLASTRQGALLREGMTIVIAGAPNAGKSSLLNALAGKDSAIVTPIAGTTRDVLREHIQIDGLPLHIIDTAGLRDSPDEVEREGIRRAWREIEKADHLLLVVDSQLPLPDDLRQLWPTDAPVPTDALPLTVVRNKCDLSAIPAAIATGEPSIVTMSAKTGDGLELLRRHLKESVGFNATGEGNFLARRRHVDALLQAREYLCNGQRQLLGAGAGELLAEDLRHCQRVLGEITGAVSADELLGKIFSSFCIGK